MLPDWFTLYNHLGPVGGALIIVFWSWFQLRRGRLAAGLRDAARLADDLSHVRALLEELRETLAVIILIVTAMAETNPNINEQAVKTALKENGHEPDDFKNDSTRAHFSLSGGDEEVPDDDAGPGVH